MKGKVYKPTESAIITAFPPPCCSITRSIRAQLHNTKIPNQSGQSASRTRSRAQARGAALDQTSSIITMACMQTSRALVKKTGIETQEKNCCCGSWCLCFGDCAVMLARVDDAYSSHRVLDRGATGMVGGWADVIGICPRNCIALRMEFSPKVYECLRILFFF